MTELTWNNVDWLFHIKLLYLWIYGVNIKASSYKMKINAFNLLIAFSVIINNVGFVMDDELVSFSPFLLTQIWNIV